MRSLEEIYLEGARSPSERQVLEMSSDVRAAARASVSDHKFSPRALLERQPEAFATWVVTYFPHRVPTIEDWEEDPIECLVLEDRGLIEVPAGTFKTTFGALLYPIWLACRDPNVEILGAFKDREEAKDALSAIREELVMNEELIRDFGPFRPPNALTAWTAHRASIAGRTRRGKTNTFMYHPWTAGVILGLRSHYRFVDDIVTEKIAFSPDQIRKQQRWFNVTFESGPYAPGSHDFKPDFAQIHVHGTKMVKHDLLGYLEERGRDGSEYSRPFRVIRCDIIKDEVEKTTITTRWPWDKLMTLKSEMGPKAFAMRMRNKVIDDETALFKECYLRGGTYRGVEYRGTRDYELTFRDAIRPSDMVCIGWDPQSGSETRHAANAAVVMLANDPTQGWAPRLADFYLGQCEPVRKLGEESQIGYVVDFAAQANTRGIIPVCMLESNNVQRAFRQPLLDLAAEAGVELRVIPENTGADKHDYESGVEATVVDFENSWLHCPAKYPSDVQKLVSFEEAFMEYGTSKFFDLLIAYWKARRYLYQQRSKRGTISGATVLPQNVPPWIAKRVLGRQHQGAILVKSAYSARAVEDVDDTVGM